MTLTYFKEFINILITFLLLILLFFVIFCIGILSLPLIFFNFSGEYILNQFRKSLDYIFNDEY